MGRRGLSNCAGAGNNLDSLVRRYTEGMSVNYLDYVHAQKQIEKLPAIFPIVLYNVCCTMASEPGLRRVQLRI